MLSFYKYSRAGSQLHIFDVQEAVPIASIKSQYVISYGVDGARSSLAGVATACSQGHRRPYDVCGSWENHGLRSVRCQSERRTSGGCAVWSVACSTLSGANANHCSLVPSRSRHPTNGGILVVSTQDRLDSRRMSATTSTPQFSIGTKLLSFSAPLPMTIRDTEEFSSSLLDHHMGWIDQILRGFARSDLFSGRDIFRIFSSLL